MSDQLLEMKGVSKGFGGPLVLDDVSFELRSGEIHVLAGENGAGKSTLMRILSGVYTEYAGEIRIKGRAVRFRSPQDAARHGISIIHQELSLVPDMTVSDNIFLGREQTGAAGWLRFHRERNASEQVLKRLGVQAQASMPVCSYPISVQQTVEIAKALAFDASIIVMDEPTSALTEPEVERLFAVIDDLKKQGCGIIYISHKMEEIYRIADRITVLRDGRYIGTSEKDGLPRQELIKWMVGRAVAEQGGSARLEYGEVALNLSGVIVPDPGGRPRPAVNNISFNVRSGEIVGLAGLQGSGTGELMCALYGAYGRVVKGQVELLGKPYIPASPRYALRRGLAMLSNDRKREGLIQGMSITRNITLPALPAYSPGGLLREGMEHGAARKRQQEFGIRAETVNQAVQTLSGGNQQKVALAKCLETQPRVLLLNEPTRGVDVGAKQDIYELMSRWSAQGIAVLLITSEMPELLALSDRIVVMHQGCITATLSGEEATPEKILSAAMGNRESEKSVQELARHDK